ncbi:hypothetical protein OHB12_23685 [Nocardia sp. NBC_01730]|uniref:hypothetical protein n=1 Tax=Nocardia sp. NBC_01730 TaxID=2975998 RepID=UPI002E145036|nr:hypothetical protein OHB12_23685 [Nocardia sp. NBC_01730]
MTRIDLHVGCGSDAGYHRHRHRHRHRRRGEQPCEHCRAAHTVAARRRRNRNGLHGRGRHVVVDAALFAAVYLETSVARQLDVEKAMGRTVIDKLVARFDRRAS